MVQAQKSQKEEIVVFSRKRRIPPASYYVLSALTLGVFHVVCKAYPKIKIMFESSSAPIEDADMLVYKKKVIYVRTEKVSKEEVTDLLTEYLRDGVYKHVYIENERRLFNWASKTYETPPSADLYIDSLTRKEKEILFGKNKLDSKIDPTWLVMFNLVFTAVNVYTIFGMLLWVKIGYKVYAGIIGLLLLYTVAIEAQRETKKNSQTREISEIEKKTYLCSKGVGKSISACDVVVGDHLIMVPFLEMPCDCVVVMGTLAVDEGFVTGESMPVLKKSGSEVLGGTVVLQALSEGEAAIECAEIEKYIATGNYAVVKATKTSFSSAKGKAFKNLTEEKTTRPLVYFDTVNMVKGVTIASIPFLGSMFLFLVRNGIRPGVAMCYVFDLLYSIVSPALPTSIWVGMSICAKRLGRKGIICKDLSITNISGNIARICFDKTGTLTEEGLEIKCVYSSGREACEIEKASKSAAKGMLLCHSVEYIENKHLGDPLDIKMLQFTKGEVDYKNTETGRKRVIKTEKGEESTVRKVFEFNPNTRRMGVIAETNGKLDYYCKGSPEVVEQLCNKDTLPAEYKEIVRKYAMEGYRVITLAGKEIETETLEKEELEKDLAFLGIIVFENKLKKDTKRTISVLKASGIENIMCTGDALLTAISVATNCGLIEKHVPVIYPQLAEPGALESIVWKCINEEGVVFDKMLMKLKKDRDYTSYADFVVAIEGDLFETLLQHPDYRAMIEKRCKVYARMNPHQKSEVVMMYKRSERVCFVGDGANDCNAIQSADVGVSLSNSERKAGDFCVSSYVLYRTEISSILAIIKEGKCTIVTTTKKIQQILIITVTQFVSLMLLQTKLLFLSDTQNIYSDIFVAIPLSIIMSRFRNSSKMTRKQPKERILVKQSMLILCVHFFVHSVHLFLIIKCMDYLKYNLALVPRKKSHLSETSQIATAVFFVFNFEILYSGLCYNPGEPFREKRRTKYLFIAFYFIHLLLLGFLLFSVSGVAYADNALSAWLAKFFNLLPISLKGVGAVCVVCASDVFLTQLLAKTINMLLRS